MLNRVHFHSSSCGTTARSHHRSRRANHAVLFSGQDVVSIRKPDSDTTELQRYLDKIGFPDLAEVTRRIKAHAVDCMLAAAKESGVELLYSGYIPDCSLGKGMALPGSDIDHWTILIRGNERGKEIFFNKLQNKLDPELIRNEWRNSYESYERNILLEADFYQVDELCRSQLGPGYVGWDISPWTSKINCFAELVRVIDRGESLYNGLSPETTEAFRQTGVYREIVSRGYNAYTNEKVKHLARANLVRHFPALPDAEKELVVRILQIPDPDKEEFPEFMNLSSTATSAQQGLERRGLLVRGDLLWEEVLKLPGTKPGSTPRNQPLKRYIAPWKPSHYDENCLNKNRDYLLSIVTGKE